MSQWLLAILLGMAGYCSMLCASPPNPTPKKENRHPTDRISFLVGGFMTAGGYVFTAPTIYHSIVVMCVHYAPAYSPLICPLHESTNHLLFRWNTFSVTAILVIYAGTYVRSLAYSELGRHFTFHLAAPDHLVTTGVYHWIQHPSYSGLAMVVVGLMSLFFRWDATPACWIDKCSCLYGWGFTISATLTGLFFCILGVRVRDEEIMLRGQFGQQWERWNRSTKRFIPGLI